VKVLHVITGELYAGAERVQDLLALGLREHGIEVGFACLKPDKFPSRRMAKDAPLHLVPMRNRWDLRRAFDVARIVRSEGYAAIHTHTPRSAMIGRLASVLAGVPMLHHVHSPTVRDSAHALRNRINAGVERLSLLGVSRLIPVSRSLADQLAASGFDPARIRLVPNGVPTPGPLVDKPAPASDWTIGCVALFRPRKGVEVLLDALRTLRSQGHRVRLRAVGPFETEAYEEALRRHVRRLELDDAVDWVGFTPDVDAEFAKMDTLILPSLYGEGMPMVVLEAMAAGVPVVATAVEGVPEVIENGVSGVVVAPGDPSSLATAVGELLGDTPDWQALRRSAYRRQSEHFSARSMSAAVARVYEEVVRPGGSARAG
jgi:phosphatidyl-myo-inositol alpha-mannosyltransferase